MDAIHADAGVECVERIGIADGRGVVPDIGQAADRGRRLLDGPGRIGPAQWARIHLALGYLSLSRFRSSMLCGSAMASRLDTCIMMMRPSLSATAIWCSGMKSVIRHSHGVAGGGVEAIGLEADEAGAADGGLELGGAHPRMHQHQPARVAALAGFGRDIVVGAVEIAGMRERERNGQPPPACGRASAWHRPGRPAPTSPRGSISRCRRRSCWSRGRSGRRPSDRCGYGRRGHWPARTRRARPPRCAGRGRWGRYRLARAGSIKTSMAAARGVALRHGGRQIGGRVFGNEAVGREGAEIDRGFAGGDELGEVVAGGRVVAEAARMGSRRRRTGSRHRRTGRGSARRPSKGDQPDALFFPLDIGETGHESAKRATALASSSGGSCSSSSRKAKSPTLTSSRSGVSAPIRMRLPRPGGHSRGTDRH